MGGQGSRSVSILNTAEISRFYFVLFVAAGFSLRTLKGAATMVSGNSNRIQYISQSNILNCYLVYFKSFMIEPNHIRLLLRKRKGKRKRKG